MSFNDCLLDLEDNIKNGKKSKKASSAGFEPARASPMDFKSISLTTRTKRLNYPSFLKFCNMNLQPDHIINIHKLKSNYHFNSLFFKT